MPGHQITRLTQKRAIVPAGEAGQARPPRVSRLLPHCQGGVPCWWPKVEMFECGAARRLGLGWRESARVTGTSHAGAGRWRKLAKTRTTSFLISLAGSRPRSPSERPLPSTLVFSKEEGERAKQSRNLDPGLAFPWPGSAATPAAEWMKAFFHNAPPDT